MGNSRIFDCQFVVQGLLCTMKCVSIKEVTIRFCTYRVDAFLFNLQDYGDDDDDDDDDNNNNNYYCVIRNENLPSSTIITFLKYG
jgi:hypothetical protein